MSGPGFARPDLCSIWAAAEQEELAEAVRGGYSAGGYPLADDDPPAPLTSGIDRAIRLSTAVADRRTARSMIARRPRSLRRDSRGAHSLGSIAVAAASARMSCVWARIARGRLCLVGHGVCGLDLRKDLRARRIETL